MRKQVISLFSISMVLLVCCGCAALGLSQPPAPTRQARLAAQLSGLRSQFKGTRITQTQPAILPAKGAWKQKEQNAGTLASAASRPAGTKVNPALEHVQVAGSGEPTLTKIDPISGKQGDTITITGQYLSTDAASNQVWFQFSSTIKTQAKVLSATPGTDAVTLKVQIPTVPPIVVDSSFGIPIYAVETDRNPAVQTNSKYFYAVPSANPTLTSVAPTEIYPDVPVTLKGTGYQWGARVHFITPDGADQFSSPGVSSYTDLSTWVPWYTCPNGGTGQIYVEDRISRQFWDPSPLVMKSNALTARFLPNAPTVTSTSKTAGEAGEPVLIGGIGFAYPQVKFEPAGPAGIVLPGYTNTSKWLCTVDSWNETQILIMLPSSSGFTKPTAGKLVITDVGGGYTKTDFTLNPAT